MFFHTAEQIALWAAEKASREGSYRIPEEKLFVMLELVRQNYYHVISPEIEDACRKTAGI
jgi:hypothetical protein